MFALPKLDERGAWLQLLVARPLGAAVAGGCGAVGRDFALEQASILWGRWSRARLWPPESRPPRVRRAAELEGQPEPRASGRWTVGVVAPPPHRTTRAARWWLSCSVAALMLQLEEELVRACCAAVLATGWERRVECAGRGVFNYLSFLRIARARLASF